MNVTDIVYLIDEQLKSKDILTETDPYSDFKPLREKIPNSIVLIEDDDIEFDLAAHGFIKDQSPKVMLTCIVPVKGKSRKQYKAEVTKLASKVINCLVSPNHGLMNDYRFKLMPRGMTPGELIIGSVKCTTYVIEISIKTDWNYDSV